MLNTYDYKISHPDIVRQLSANDMLSVFYKCPQVERVVHIFTHYNEIVYTLSGIKTLHHKDKSWDLTEDKAVFIRRTAYQQEKYDFAGWEVIAFIFNDNILRRVYKEYQQLHPVKNRMPAPVDMLLDINANETIRTFFYGMIPYFTQKIPPTQSLLELKFKELLFNIFSDPANAAFIAYVESINSEDYKTPLWEIMNANYTYNLSIEEFARIAQRSIATFKREFKDYYHTSPGKWLTDKRLEYAAQLLTNSKKNISEVAYGSGFENLSHFSRVFKEKYQLSPLQYRNNL